MEKFESMEGVRAMNINFPMTLNFETPQTSKKKVLLRGPLLTQSGYGVHSRQIAKWLFSREDLDVDVQALPWGETPWLINDDLDSGFIGQIIKKTVDPNGRLYDATVQVQLPNEWDPRLGRVNIGITASVETDRANPEWAAACNKMSMVIVPSKHSADSLVNAGPITTPVNIVPESYSPALSVEKKTRVDDIEFSTPFNFLIFGQITGNNPENDRKNIFYCIKWLCEIFENDKDVGIVVKTNMGRNTHIDRKLVTQTFQALMKEVRKKSFPKLHLVHGDMSDEEVASLYRHPKIKALVTPTRGEGYGLPILEAAVSGLPVIATNWSGHVDFLSKGKFIELGYRLEQIHPSRIDNRIFMPGVKWANVLEEEFKKKVLKFRNSPFTPKEWALELKAKLLKEYSIESIIKSYNDVTGGLL